MKISIVENEDLEEVVITIHCKSRDEKILKIMESLVAIDKRLAGIKDKKTYLLDLNDVLYFDIVDKKTFIYTTNDVYETDLKLYELENSSQGRFFRCSKSVVINITKVKTIMPDFGSRLKITLLNNEKLQVSRQYAQELKIKLGI